MIQFYSKLSLKFSRNCVETLMVQNKQSSGYYWIVCLSHSTVIFHSDSRGHHYYKQLAPKSCYVQSARVKVLAASIRGNIVVGRCEFSRFSTNAPNLTNQTKRFIVLTSSIQQSISLGIRLAMMLRKWSKNNDPHVSSSEETLR